MVSSDVISFVCVISVVIILLHDVLDVVIIWLLSVIVFVDVIQHRADKINI